MADDNFKSYAVTVFVDTYDETTARTEVKEALDNVISLQNVEVYEVQEMMEE